MPKPSAQEVESALQTLNAAGINPMKGKMVREAYLTHVVEPQMPQASADDLKIYRDALSDPKAHNLTPEMQIILRRRLQAGN